MIFLHGHFSFFGGETIKKSKHQWFYDHICLGQYFSNVGIATALKGGKDEKMLNWLENVIIFLYFKLFTSKGRFCMFL